MERRDALVLLKEEECGELKRQVEELVREKEAREADLQTRTEATQADRAALEGRVRGLELQLESERVRAAHLTEEAEKAGGEREEERRKRESAEKTRGQEADAYQSAVLARDAALKVGE